MKSVEAEEYDLSLLAYTILICLIFAFYSDLLFQLGLRVLVGTVVKSLVPISTWLGVIAGAVVGTIPVVLFVMLLRWVLPLVCQHSKEGEPIRDSRPFAYLHYGLAIIAGLVLLISLVTLGDVQLKPSARLCAYLQLVPLAAAGIACLTQRAQSQAPLSSWLNYHDLNAPVGRIGWLVTDLVCYGLLFGLTAYVLCLSNVLNLLFQLSPVDWADPLLLHGMRLGMLIAIWRTPITEGSRTLMSMAFLVDWLLEKIINPWFVPPVQLALVIAGIAPFYSFPFGLKRALRIGFGLCAGRVVGRIVGALFLGEAGPVLFEPISEVVMAMWLLQTAPEEPDQEAA